MFFSKFLSPDVCHCADTAGLVLGKKVIFLQSCEITLPPAMPRDGQEPDTVTKRPAAKTSLEGKKKHTAGDQYLPSEGLRLKILLHK